MALEGEHTFYHAQTGTEDGDESDAGSGGFSGVGVAEGSFSLVVTAVRIPELLSKLDLTARCGTYRAHSTS